MPRIAVLCGTGMSAFSEILLSEIGGKSDIFYAESNWGQVPINLVVSDAGTVFIIDRHHSISEKRTPPHQIEHRANVHAAVSCKPDLLVSVNSVGSLTESMPPGMVGITGDVLDLAIRPWTFHDFDAIHEDRTSAFDNDAIDICSKSLNDSQGMAPKDLVLAQCIGPQFESPSEINALEKLGANLVGMTLGPEARLISECEISHISLACSSNWAAGRTPGDPKATIDHYSVDKIAEKMRKTISKCIKSLLGEFGD